MVETRAETFGSSGPPVASDERAPTVAAGHTHAYNAALAAALGSQRSDFVPLRDDVPADVPAVKLIAFYLPQFHPIPENDLWWGRGFTEWVNVSKAVPQFAGHYQPHLPGELGFYDLRLPEVQRRQVALARTYGVSGFCFHYYWFAGRRLLDRPLAQFMSDSHIDFPFCICWANENWTRHWDGLDDEILVRQDHSDVTDAAFIRDIEPILRHRSYIRIDGRPVLIVYRVRLFSDPLATVRRWRAFCRDRGLGDPYLIAAEVFENIDPRAIGFDAAIEFPPNTPGPRNEITRDLVLANPSYAGRVYGYTDLHDLTARRPRPPYQLFKTVCPGWDNEPRGPGRGSTYAFSSPAAYGRWLNQACRFTLADPDPEKHLVFINAWNEWAEGAHLEPDRRYGYAYLQQTADVLRSLRKPLIASWTMLFVSPDANRGSAQLILLNVLGWFHRRTSIRLKLFCVESGEWLSRFQELADTIVLSELEERAAIDSDVDISNQLRAFCGGAPDLIYVNSSSCGSVYPALSELHAPILTHVHELETGISRLAAAWIGEIFEHSVHFIACSPAVRENLVVNHGIAASDVSTIYSSISVDADFAPLADHQRSAERNRLGLLDEKVLIFGYGLGNPLRTGMEVFIQIARCVGQLGREDLHFCWIGPFDEHHVAALQAADASNVTLLRSTIDAKAYLRTGDVFLMPSREDPSPIVALEAAQCALPIVCFADSGAAAAFVDGDAGYIVRSGDVDAMARQVVALADDEGHRRALSARSREKVLNAYTVEHTTPHILSTCRTLARQKPAVSIIVPGCSPARYLDRRLESIFDQTYRDFEVIVLDDGSADGSVAILSKYRDRADLRIVSNAPDQVARSNAG